MSSALFLLPVSTLLSFAGEVWVTDWAIFPTFVAAFSRNEEVMLEGVCGQICQAVWWECVTPPSGCAGLVDWGGMGCEHLCAM